MMKSLRLLLRAGAAEADAFVFEHTGVAQIEQRIEEALAAHGAARHELAVAVAHATRERRALADVERRITDLEGRTLEALARGRTDLAEEAAHAIAALENDRDKREQTSAEFDVRLERLRFALDDGNARMSALRRGLRAARAKQALQRLAGSGSRSASAAGGAIEDAEAMLQRLENNLAASEDVQQARRAIGKAMTHEDLVDRLAAAGCGSATGATAASVLARLKDKIPSLPAG